MDFLGKQVKLSLSAEETLFLERLQTVIDYLEPPLLDKEHSQLIRLEDGALLLDMPHKEVAVSVGALVHPAEIIVGIGNNPLHWHFPIRPGEETECREESMQCLKELLGNTVLLENSWFGQWIGKAKASLVLEDGQERLGTIVQLQLWRFLRRHRRQKLLFSYQKQV
ncbi:MAG: hypothetical protein IJP03_00245 [Christensenellaceae bacterium]|nr:hypothetical protein [Christensenellaceae bacterium]